MDVPFCKEITFIFQCPGGGQSRAETACRKIGLAENPILKQKKQKRKAGDRTMTTLTIKYIEKIFSVTEYIQRTQNRISQKLI